ncbi:MAG: serine/threonine-protein phosphatase [Clostridia bacterium]|nr:serine/threonine-protein phosphatase [Clostridia bacterium]
MKVFGKSDIGNVRKANEDVFGTKLIADNALIAVVCDGMGGLDLGDVASELAMRTFIETVERLCASHIKKRRLSLSDTEADLILQNAVTVANNRIIAKQEELDVSEGMGTTLVAALIVDGGKRISWANIGDSRLYTVDSRDILQVSKDHSYVQYMLDQGKLTLEEAKKSKKKNLITKAIGIDVTCSPDTDTFPLSSDEVKETKILLCSDGFSNSVSEEECMAITMNPSLSTEQKVNSLIELAKKNDGSDNITLIMIDLNGD